MASWSTKTSRRLEILISSITSGQAADLRPRLSLQCARMSRQSAGLPPGCAYLLFLSMVTRYHNRSLLAQPLMVSVEAAVAQHRFAFSQDWSSAILSAPTSNGEGAERLMRLSPERFCDDR